jgi:hypothetical protein
VFTKFCAGLTSVQQQLNTLTAESCTALALDAIKDALAAVLGISASSIHLECPTAQSKSTAHVIVKVDTDDDETRRKVFEIMSNKDAFIKALNTKLPGEENDLSDATTPAVNTKGKG